MGIWIESPSGYMTAQPLGVLLVDYNGKPGYGQAYPLLLDVTTYKLILPLIHK